jgi:ubiquinone/menaquinone biosynthesis C-methylase UbiE
MQDNYQQKKQVQRDYYNATAAKYDAWHTETESAKIVDAWNFVNLKKFLKNNKVNKSLDVACGTGRLTNSLLQVSEEVYGIDLSEEVLNIAKQKYPQVNFTLGEVVNLPYQDNFFDLVVINGSLHHFFAMNKTFQEIYRVLKPEGKFIILGEPNANYHRWFNPFFYLWILVRLITRVLNIFKAQKTVPPEMIEPDAEVFLPSQMKQALIKTGFKIEQFYTYDYLPRTEARGFLKIYKAYLKLEHRTLAKIFPGLGSAIQFLAKK